MFFDIIFFIYTLIYSPYLILTGRWYKGYSCRLGLIPSSIKKRLSSTSSVWIHAVSVGEIMAIASMVEKIALHFPAYTIVVTTTTKTGYELAKNKFKDKIVVLPSPLDFSWVSSIFVRVVKPKIYLAAETEIWPNLFHCLHKQKVPIVMINGRISDVSFGRYKAIKFLLRGTLKEVSWFCMQSDTNAQRIIELGADKEKVSIVGNIKFDDFIAKQDSAVQIPRFKTRPLWVAGSTHPGEEKIILDAFVKYKESWALAIAPRHVERSDEIISLIHSYGLKAVRLSQVSSDSFSEEMVLVVDTIGQLREFYAQASLVFVGKSLCVGGGHNIIEPAFYTKSIIVGPLMQNFKDIIVLFKAQGAIVQVADINEFEQQVACLMKDKNLRTQLGQRAYSVVKANQGAGNRTVKMLEKWI